MIGCARPTLTALARLVVIAAVLAAGDLAFATTDPLAGIVLEDVAGRPWAFDELRDGPVLLVIADRDAAPQAEEWGERLAARTTRLAPWQATGKVAWVSVADLRRVPEYARDTARTRLREHRVARRGGTAAISPLLLDWRGLLAERFPGERGAVVLVLLGSNRQTLARATGAPTDTAVTQMLEAVAATAVESRAAPP